MNYHKTSIKWQEAFIIICLLLHNVLDIYSVGGRITFGNVADVLAFVLSFTVGRKGNHIPRTLWAYIFYRIVFSFISASSLQSSIPIGFLLQVAALCATFRAVSLANFIKIYKVLGFITSAFLLIQFLSFSLLGIKINGILSFIPLAIGGDDFLNVVSLRVRQSSIFSEPAHFAEFILPLLCIQLFDERINKSIPFILLCVVSLLLSMSGTALLGLLVVFGLYFIKLFFAQKSGKKTIALVFMLAVVPVVFYYYSRSEMGSTVLGRTESVKYAQDATAISSEYVRIFRGYDVYGSLSTTEKIFGCGNKETIIKRISNSSYSILFDNDSFYFNGVSTVLLYTGLLGLILYALALASIWKGNSFCGKSFIILLIVFMLIASILMNSTAIVLLFLAAAYKKSYLINNAQPAK